MDIAADLAPGTQGRPWGARDAVVLGGGVGCEGEIWGCFTMFYLDIFEKKHQKSYVFVMDRDFPPMFGRFAAGLGKVGLVGSPAIVAVCTAQL